MIVARFTPGGMPDGTFYRAPFAVKAPAQPCGEWTVYQPAKLVAFPDVATRFERGEAWACADLLWSWGHGDWRAVGCSNDRSCLA